MKGAARLPLFGGCDGWEESYIHICMKKNKIIKGAAILAAAGAACKVIGALYRIPLANLLGAEGMADYQAAYPIYALLLVIATGGLPPAISKLVAGNAGQGAERILRTSLLFFMSVGAVFSAALFLLRGPLAEALGLSSSAPAIGAIAPSILFATGVSALRGYFQGRCDMIPTAVSQVIEQVMKLIVGLLLAWRLYPLGESIAAAGAMLGVTAGEIVAFLALLFRYMRKRPEILPQKTGQSGCLKAILLVALPVTLSACVVPIEGVIDSAMVVNLMTASGASIAYARTAFGIFTGFVCPVAAVPAVMTMALNQSLLPAIAEAKTAGDMASMEKRAHTGLSLSIIIGLPMTALLFVLGGDILGAIFPSLTSEELAFATGLMKVDCLTVGFISVIHITSALLHATGHTVIPLVSLGAGCIVKVAVGAMTIPVLGVVGAAIGSAACFAAAIVPCLVLACKYTHVRLSFARDVLPPLASTALAVLVMAALAGGRGIVSVALACLASAAAYFLCLATFTALTRGGQRIYNNSYAGRKNAAGACLFTERASHVRLHKTNASRK